MNYLLAFLLFVFFVPSFAIQTTVSLKHTEGKGLGFDQGYTTLDLLTMKNWKNSEAMIDLRGHVFNSGKFAGNGGLGIRSTVHNCDLIGMHGYYDFRCYHHLFEQQISGGIEYLSRNFHIRVDGYLPFGKKGTVYNRKFVGFQSSHILVKEKIITTIPMAELELGFPVKSGFYFASGPYYFFSQEIKGYKIGDAWGGKVRLSWDIGSYLTVEGNVTYDPVFDFGGTGFVRFNFPLGKKYKEEKCNYSFRGYPIVRNEIIPVKHANKTKTLNKPGQFSDPLTVVFVNNTSPSGGSGTFESPFVSLKEAELHSQKGDVIYVFPGDHTSKNMDEGIVLKSDQLLISSGKNFKIDDVEIPALTPSELPLIGNKSKQEPIITPANDYLLSDFFNFFNEALNISP